MGYKVLITDQIDEIAVKILEDVCEVHYRPSSPLRILKTSSRITMP